jgi:molybdopterin molybdotransferase
MAQATLAGGLARFYGIVADQPEALRATFGRALAENEVLVVSGGVSMGDFDHIPAALAAAGAEAVFHQLLMRPGKPTWFGWRPGDDAADLGCAAFGLPGNPVSTFVNFEVLVRPLIQAMAGEPYRPTAPSARMAVDFRRKNTSVVEFIPMRFNNGLVHPLAYHGSSMLNILGEANALLRMEIGQESLKEGETADVRLIRA